MNHISEALFNEEKKKPQQLTVIQNVGIPNLPFKEVPLPVTEHQHPVQFFHQTKTLSYLWSASLQHGKLW